MPRGPRPLAPGLVYHVIARGNHREPIFLARPDYRAYLARLGTYRRQFQAMLHAYCLMPNHVHLLIQVGEMPLSGLMQGVQQSYTVYFNRTYGTVGHLFQGRYKALVCDGDAYLATLVRYIHLNPVRAGLVVRPEDHPYSSHTAYLRGRPSDLVDPRPILQLLGGRKQYRLLVLPAADGGEGAGDEREAEDAGNGRARAALGLQPRGADPADGVQRRTRELPATLVDTLARWLGADPDTVRSVDRSRKVSHARSVIAFTLVRRLGYPIATVAAALQREPTSIAVLLCRLARRLESDPALSAEVVRLCRNV